MSVINDMLRDLDKRQAPEVSGASSVVQESLIEPQPSPYKKWAILFVGILVLMALAYVFLRDNHVPLALQSETEAQEAKKVVAVDPQKNASISQQSSPSDETLTDAKATIQLAKEPAVLNSSDTPRESSAVAVKHRQNAITAPREGKKPLVEKKSLADNKPLADKKPLAEKKPLADKKPLAQKTPLADPVLQANKKSSAEKLPQLNTPQDVSGVVNKTQVDTNSQPANLANQQASLSNTAMGVTLSPVALDQQTADRATKLFEQGKALEAYRELYGFIGESSEDSASRAVLAAYLLAENRLAEAGDLLLNASLSKSPKLRQLKARWFAAQGKHNLAIYTLTSDLPSIEAFPDYYVLLAAYYQRYGSPSDASKTYALLVEYNETIADWWAGLGLATDRNGDTEKAIFAYRQALDLVGLSPALSEFVQPRLQQLLASMPSAAPSSNRTK